MMPKHQKLFTDFWEDPIILEEMDPVDKYFYLYLLTNPNTTKTGRYYITEKQMAVELGYSIVRVRLLLERFIKHFKLIRYNPETEELIINDWRTFIKG
ncbi:hypothetical protein [Metabacillus sp. 22489]|uniref:hypothetical protein n=1 Tax=Metabacillus sp. 22489 TaxID=3453928 RepID=UPI003F84403C